MGLSLFDERFPVMTIGALEAVLTPTTLNSDVGAVSGTRYDALLVGTNDTADVLIQIALVGTAEEVSILGTILLPAGAGTDGVHPCADLIASLPNPQGGIVLAPACQVRLIVVNALTAGKSLYYAFMGARL